MQKILCINVSAKPAVAMLVAVEQKQISILEQHSADLADLFNQNTNNAAISEDEQVTNNKQLLGQAAFRELLNRFSDTWTSSVLLISGATYIAMDVRLPFKTYKEINKVVALEVQDLLPFDIDEFVLDYSIIEQANNDGLNDIHVGLLPRKFVQSVLETCKQCDFDPVVITSPASVLGSLPALLPNYFEENCAFLYFTEQACYSAYRFAGKVRADRIFLSDWLAASQSRTLSSELLREFKIYLAALESRFDCNVAKIYVIQSQLTMAPLQEVLGRELVALDSQSIIATATNGSNLLTAVAAIFVRDVQPVRPLTNFRTQEFSFRPQLKNLQAGVKALYTYLGLAVALLLLWIVFEVGFTNYQISTVKNAILEQISKKAPELNTDTHNSVVAINQLTTELENELTSLGSPSRYSALDIISQMTRDLKKHGALNITQLKIIGNIVTLAGNADSYGKADELRSLFKRRHEMYCKVNRDTSAVVGGERGFQFSLELCT